MMAHRINLGVRLWAVFPCLLSVGHVSRGLGATTYFVDDNAAGGDGLSWTSPFPDLQSALGLSMAGDEIRVAGGTYTPSALTDPGDPRTATFSLRDGVTIRGGYAGLQDPADPNRRDLSVFASTLTGDLSRDDDPEDFSTRQDNAYHVLVVSNINAAILDGMTITAGTADQSAAPGYWGGGALAENSTFTMTDCVIDGNYARSGGAGIMLISVADSLFQRCRFSSNLVDPASGQVGGAVRMSASSPALVACDFMENSAPGAGAVHVGNGAPLFRNCRFIQNTATGSGGAMIPSATTAIVNSDFLGNSALDGGGLYINGSLSSPITNCVFSGNAATRFGGAMFLSGFNSAIYSCSLTANTAGVRGGGILIQGGRPQLANTILYDNSDPGGTDESAQIDLAGGALDADYDCVQGWSGVLDAEGVGNMSSNPLFLDPVGADHVPGTADDNLRLEAQSPCLDAGSRQYVSEDFADLDDDGDTMEALPFDRDGRARFIDSILVGDTGAGFAPVIDIGAFESQDCNGNGILDVSEISMGVVEDCNQNGVPDSCESSGDCNDDGVLDVCDLFFGSPDCNANRIPDECEADCNSNGVADDCDIANGTSTDCGCLGVDGIPDECETDCTPEVIVEGVTAFFGPGDDPDGDIAFQQAVAGCIDEFDLDGLDTIDTLGPFVDVRLVDNNGNVVASVLESFTSSVIDSLGEYGTVQGETLLNRGNGVVEATIEFDFLIPIEAFGVWVFDDTEGIAQRHVLVIEDTDGRVIQLNPLDSCNGAPWAVEGFMGASVSSGITRASVRVENTVGDVTAIPFEIDHIQVAHFRNDWMGVDVCLSGPGISSGVGCGCYDVDDDGDVDMRDFAEIQWMSGIP